jgi:hypothetical protein
VELFFPIQWAFWIAATLAEVLVLYRLYRENLLRIFPFFAAFLTADLICTVALMRLDPRSQGYAQAYRACELILTIFRVGVAAELYERICKHFPGIGTFRAILASVLILLTLLVVVSTFRPNLAGFPIFSLTIMVNVLRFQAEVFAGAFILTWIFLRFLLSIRQPYRPNVLNHWTIATVYFGASGAGYLAILLAGGGAVDYAINCVMIAIQLACFVAWFRLLRRSGEELPDFARLSPDQVQAVENYDRELLQTVRSLPNQISARQAENRDIL